MAAKPTRANPDEIQQYAAQGIPSGSQSVPLQPQPEREFSLADRIQQSAGSDPELASMYAGMVKPIASNPSDPNDPYWQDAHVATWDEPPASWEQAPMPWDYPASSGIMPSQMPPKGLPVSMGTPQVNYGPQYELGDVQVEPDPRDQLFDLMERRQARPRDPRNQRP